MNIYLFDGIFQTKYLRLYVDLQIITVYRVLFVLSAAELQYYVTGMKISLSSGHM